MEKQKEPVNTQQSQSQQCQCPIIINDSNDLCEFCKYELNQWLDHIEICCIDE